MKRILAMILTAILLLSACGQKEPVPNETKTQKQPEKETETEHLTAFFADKNVPDGMVAVWFRTKQINRTSTLETQEWIDTYDETGNRLMLSRYPAGGYRTEYKYGDDGKLQEIIYFPNEEEGNHDTYEYDLAGNLITIISSDNEGNELSRIVKTYDEKGNLLKTEEIYDNVSFFEEYVYDTQGRIVEATYSQYKFGSGEVTIFTRNDRYEYGENGSYKKYANGSLEREEIYDAEGRKLEVISYADGVESYKQQWQYDDAGKLAQMNTYENGKLRYQYNYQYDTDGNLLERTSPLDQGGEKRTYDSVGNITEYAVYLEDGTAEVQVKAQYDDACHVEIKSPMLNDFIYTGTISYEDDDTIYIELESNDGQYGAQWTYERVIVTPERAEELAERYGEDRAIVFANRDFPILDLISAKS